MNEKLSRIYYNENNPLPTIQNLYKMVKRDGYTHKDVKDWVANQETNQMLSIPKVKKIYQPIVGKNNDYQCDLMFLPQYKNQNNNYYIIFCFIEITSRKAYVYALKNKNEQSIIEAYQQFLKAIDNKINTLTSDNGSEFLSKAFQAIDKQHNIEHYFVDLDDKTRVGKVERFNRTVRNRIKKYQVAFKTLTYINALPKLIESYNNTEHSRTGYTPNEADNDEKIKEKIRNKYNKNKTLAYDLINSFKIGDKVRLLKRKDAFQKGEATYTKNIYEIVKIDKLSLQLKKVKTGEILDQRVKPYNVKKIDSENVGIAPDLPDVEQHDFKQNRKDNKFINKQKRVDAFDVVDNKGKVEVPKRLEVTQPREKQKYIEVGDRVQSLFNVGKEQKLFLGTVQKVNAQTYRVLFDDNENLLMKKEEVTLIK